MGLGGSVASRSATPDLVRIVRIARMHLIDQANVLKYFKEKKMGIIRKAVIGSMIIGAGALVAAQNKKAVTKIKKDVTKAAKKVLRSPVAKKIRRKATQ